VSVTPTLEDFEGTLGNLRIFGDLGGLEDLFLGGFLGTGDTGDKTVTKDENVLENLASLVTSGGSVLRTESSDASCSKMEAASGML
jgi:hypothetical protein